MKKPALFLDRDGTINHLVLQKETGDFDVPYQPDQVALVAGIVDIIALANQHGIPTFVVTNQPAYALGKISLETMHAIDEKITALLKQKGVSVQGFYRCLHHPDAGVVEMQIACNCRKPEPGLFYQARDEHGIDLAQSVFVGDKVTDMQAGEKAGCHTILYLHRNDLSHKVEAAYAYATKYRVTDHTETLAIIRTLFDLS